MYEFVGIIKQKVGERSGEGQNGPWKVAQFLLETVEMDPKKMVVEVFDGVIGRVAEFEALMGKAVRVEWEIDAREYPQGSGKWFNSHRAYKVYDRALEQAKAVEAAEEARKEAEKNAAVAHQPTVHQTPPADDPFDQMQQNNGSDLPY